LARCHPLVDPMCRAELKMGGTRKLYKLWGLPPRKGPEPYKYFALNIMTEEKLRYYELEPPVLYPEFRFP